MSIKAKVNGAIKTVSNCKVKVGGAWKQVTTALIKENGAWKQAWRNIIEILQADGLFHTIPVSGATASSTIVLTDVRLEAIYNGTTYAMTGVTLTAGSSWKTIKVDNYPNTFAIVGIKVIDGGVYISFTGSDQSSVSVKGTNIKLTIGGITLS